MDSAIRFLTGAFPYSPEFQNVGMAVQGAMTVRKGPNKDGKLHWFHALVLSVVAAFGGGIFNFIWMGKPSGLIANDMTMGSCLIAFFLVNLVPFGFLLCSTLPVSVLIVSSAQLFRSLGLVKFCKAAFVAFKDNPSAYYPVPVLGPIIYATLLGNMGPLVMKGLQQHVGNGAPWPVQNGVFCATFYLFYALDTVGPVGKLLRQYIPVAKMLGLDDETFATAFVSLFMQVTGVLQMAEFLGPGFTPFWPGLLSPFLDPLTWMVRKEETASPVKQEAQGNKRLAAQSSAGQPNTLERSPIPTEATDEISSKKKKKKKKGKAANSAKEKEL